MASSPSATPATATATPNPTPPKKSRWQKLKEENEERKKNSVQHITAAQAQQRTGYDENGKPATEWRKEQNARWHEEQKEDNRQLMMGLVKMKLCVVM